MDYKSYRLSARESARIFLQGAGIILIIGWLFYQSLPAVLFLLPFLFFWFHRKKREKAEQRRWNLMITFMDGMTGISSALRAGYSVENAFREALRDLALLYEQDSDIIQEFQMILYRIGRNVPVERTIEDLANRSGLEEIRQFSQVFSIAKRTGGNLVQMIQASVSVIQDKIGLKRELRTAVAAKRMEGRIMCLMPLGIILYLRLCSPGFLDPLYHNTMGILCMSLALFLYMTAFFLQEKILNIG
ncbi:type II secretion system F family protein [Anaerolentibacter hominis]|uniref:type II secretion system F family protein n=1 Tax=Anaerolentibacter hominis TaxID=3079009 RepID=UPI0031B88E1D